MDVEPVASTEHNLDVRVVPFQAGAGLDRQAFTVFQADRTHLPHSRHLMRMPSAQDVAVNVNHIFSISDWHGVVAFVLLSHPFWKEPIKHRHVDVSGLQSDAVVA